MGDLATKFSSSRQDWGTPDDLFLPLHREFGFTLDAAASAENTKAPTFFTEHDDALSKDWGDHTVWLNPPFGCKKSPLKAWLAKSVKAAHRGATVVMLVPARTNTNWFHNLCLKFGEVRFVKGRPKFNGADHGLPQPLCIVIFRPPSTIGRITRPVQLLDQDWH